MNTRLAISDCSILFLIFRLLEFLFEIQVELFPQEPLPLIAAFPKAVRLNSSDFS